MDYVYVELLTLIQVRRAHHCKRNDGDPRFLVWRLELNNVLLVMICRCWTMRMRRLIGS